MHVSEAIEQLGRDRSIQRCAQSGVFAVLDTWRNDSGIAPVLSSLAAYGAGEALEGCEPLLRIVRDHDAGRAFADSFVAALCVEMRRSPFAQVALRHNCGDTVSALQLGGAGRARLFLMSREPRCSRAMQASYIDLERHELVLSGTAQGRDVTRSPAGLDVRDVRFAAGGHASTDCYRQAILLDKVPTRLTTLRLEREAAMPRPTTLHSIEDGRVVHRAQGCKRTSRHEMMVTLLGRMECEEAAPVLADMALSERPRDLRWQALRELLGMNSAAGFAALGNVAARPGDPLAPHAGALRSELLRTHPQLASLEASRCPA